MWKLGCDAQGQVKKGRCISEDHQHEEGLNFKVCLEICVTANTAVGLCARQCVCGREGQWIRCVSMCVRACVSYPGHYRDTR